MLISNHKWHPEHRNKQLDRDMNNHTSEGGKQVDTGPRNSLPIIAFQPTRHISQYFGNNRYLWICPQSKVCLRHLASSHSEWCSLFAGSHDVLTSFWMDSEADSNAETNSGTSSDMPRLEAPTPIKRRWTDKYDSLPSPATMDARHEYWKWRRRRAKSV